MMRGNYTRELDEVSLRIQNMGTQIGEAVEKTRTALENVDAKAARELIEDEDIRNSTIAFPTSDMLENCETFQYLGDDVDTMYMDYWNKVKSS